MARKSAAGTGMVRKVQKTVKGKKYVYWEGRYTEGFDPGTGKQIQKSIYGKTQKEVAAQLRSITKELDEGTFTEPCKMTLSAWLDIWLKTYLRKVKPATVCSYTTAVNHHIKPSLGAVRLNDLRPDMIQAFYNRLLDGDENHAPLSTKTVRNIHGAFHKAMEQAVKIGNLRTNPCNSAELPKVDKKKIQPMTEAQITAFLNAIRGHKYQDIFTVTLFTGLREAEAMGLTWDCVDFKKSQITIDKQLQQVRGGNGEYRIAPTKSSNIRIITAAPFVMALLKETHRRQLVNRIQNADVWTDSNFVFTDEVGNHIKTNTLYKSFKAVMEEIGLPDFRFHDLRHTYAVVSLQSGDDIKTLQENLGHATASFTLDVYGHVSEQMKKESANRMQQFIMAVNK